MPDGDEPSRGPGKGDDARSPVDVIVARDGVMPPARTSLRLMAFLLDYLLIVAIAVTVVARFVVPQTYPGTMNDFLAEWLEFVETTSSGGDDGEGGVSEEWKATFETVQEVVLLVIWVYFAIGEAFFRGSSLGKRAFRLRSVSLVTLGPPGIFAGIVRAALKAIVVMYWIPLLLVDLLPLLFNRRGQLGHDLMTRTFVLDERHVKEG